MFKISNIIYKVANLGCHKSPNENWECSIEYFDKSIITKFKNINLIRLSNIFEDIEINNGQPYKNEDYLTAKFNENTTCKIIKIVKHDMKMLICENQFEDDRITRVRMMLGHYDDININ